jgi:hypothetical protein
MDPMPTPVAIQLHDQPDRAVAEAAVTVVKRPFGFNPVLWFHFTRHPSPGCFVSQKSTKSANVTTEPRTGNVNRIGRRVRGAAAVFLTFFRF